MDEFTGTESGSGSSHLGWDDGKICLGAGPIRLKYTRQEAVDLATDIIALVNDPRTTPCGCD